MAKVTTLVKPEADSKFGITCESEVDVDGDGIADVVERRRIGTRDFGECEGDQAE